MIAERDPLTTPLAGEKKAPPILRRPDTYTSDPAPVDLSCITNLQHRHAGQWTYTITFTCGHSEPGCGNGPNQALAHRERDARIAARPCHSCTHAYCCETHRWPIRKRDPNCAACNPEAAWAEVERERCEQCCGPDVAECGWCAEYDAETFAEDSHADA